MPRLYLPIAFFSTYYKRHTGRIKRDSGHKDDCFKRAEKIVSNHFPTGHILINFKDSCPKGYVHLCFKIRQSYRS